MQQRVKLKSSSVITLVLVTVVIFSCLALALWQWQRAADKQQLQQQQDLQLGLSAIQTLSLSAAKNNGLSTILKGRFSSHLIWFLDNQVLNGKAGFDALALFTLNDYPNKKVLVNLGFVEALGMRKTPSISLPEHEVSLEVIIKSKDIKGFTLASKSNMNIQQPQLLQYVDLEFLSRSTQQSLFQLVAYQQGVDAIVAIPHYQHVVMPADKHRAYALQWLLIAVAAGAIAFFAIKRGKYE
ncbi:hypothetical protein PSECIP111951_01928 [Pseudoalteromonas holothuriae]|uniref:SURF1-like protein n=1 Tax=Pseudoalteromonas holothuriae TaxID=2963714 RepID=A0A9W4VTF1_9GAMM|nr:MULTISPECIES: SURF1 family protein [unclassified Pseudoalteromonas]CAH9054166.1 hypothetical protein PSECIP111854_01311 [Pseudoalteromonas sp. CIP111854]CAH9058715.1 hypothetical protein PSECIP111951_01928 [Pseudoalteromonas sp. CIP111951]